MHWSLDDWPHLHWRPGRGDAFTAPELFLATWLAEFESALRERRHVTFTMHPEVIGRGHRAALLERLIDEMRSKANVWFADAWRCGSLRDGMTFAVHRSDEPTARERGEAFGRAHAPAIRHSIAVYERMFAETGVSPGDIRVPDWAHEELSAMADGAGVPLHGAAGRQRAHRGPGRRGPDRVLGGRRRRPAGAELGLASGRCRSRP